MKKFAVILSGCGVYDGAEIHEATLTMLSIVQQGGTYEIFAPDIHQHHVINHLTGAEMKEQRNVLIESARIARGKIKDLKAFKPDDFDALIMPGGFGAAKNLCNFAFMGDACEVNPDVAYAVKSTHAEGKPIGALCIAPVIVARLIGSSEVTIGQDEGTIIGIEKMGGKHVKTSHGQVVHDKKNNVFTTPCYMLNANISQIYEGAFNIVKAMMA
ncbi:MAG: isoprenoid biosynthesis glyoxalase ElbB [Bacteroidales bacterium]|nr:isoprenoid biosynthesis glyoxalase ElbB [Bacteroidales bacterium]